MIGHDGLLRVFPFARPIRGSGHLNCYFLRHVGIHLIYATTSSFLIMLLMVSSHCHDDCDYSVTLSGIVVVVISQSSYFLALISCFLLDLA